MCSRNAPKDMLRMVKAKQIASPDQSLERILHMVKVNRCLTLIKTPRTTMVSGLCGKRPKEDIDLCDDMSIGSARIQIFAATDGRSSVEQST
ncbi:hypothetical protein QVD17_19642 [Tagetes erecta]|uniref:Uncharacterized protein n=1 Tax=Tagetes erecta TaxID=13708 RepID=A0AAD8KRC3_TARER|nr:hypothetical protein QVD17_19642 [Tagetes erecta]